LQPLSETLRAAKMKEFIEILRMVFGVKVKRD